MTHPFADRHRELWEWAQTIEVGQAAPAFFAIWPRESAKTTAAQMVVVYLGAEHKRSYVWYISATQEQANDHVMTLGAMLTSGAVETYYPRLAERKLTKFGAVRAFRQTRLWTAHGLIIDAVGLDTARRGVKLEQRRPDLIVFDDVDNHQDSPNTVTRKANTIKSSLLPAGSEHLTVLIAQNLVHAGSVVQRVLEGYDRMLTHRVVSGPYPVVADLKTEYRDGRDVIVGGTATWEGQDLAYAQRKIDLVTLPTFLTEYQNEVGEDARHPWKVEWFDLKSGRNRYDHRDQALLAQVERRWIFADTSYKDQDEHDPSAIVVIDMLPVTHDYRLLLRYADEEWLLSADLPDWLREHAERWNLDGKLRGVVVEDKASGTTAIQTLRKVAPTWLAKITFDWMPNGSKLYRAKAASTWARKNMIMFPYPDTDEGIASWYSRFINEGEPRGQLFQFPFVDHDDMVDALSMGVLYLENYIEVGYHNWMQRAEREADRDDGHTRRIA